MGPSPRPLVLALVLLAVGLRAQTVIEIDPEDLEPAPWVGTYDVRVTIDHENATVPITIYSGDLDDAVVVLRDTLRVGSRSYDLAMDRMYSALARYRRGNDTILVLDEAWIRAESQEYQDASCWEVKKGAVDLRLMAR